MLSSLDVVATPPFDTAHDHFGFRDRLSQPVIEGAGDEPTPGSGQPLKAGEFILGYPNENGRPSLPQPEILSRNGSYMAYRRLQEHVGQRFETFSARWRNTRRAGTYRSQANGSMEERRSTRAGSRQEILPWRRLAAKQ